LSRFSELPKLDKKCRFCSRPMSVVDSRYGHCVLEDAELGDRVG